jgi:hypothetical protein
LLKKELVKGDLGEATTKLFKTISLSIRIEPLLATALSISNL